GSSREGGRGGCDSRKNEIGLQRDEFLREPPSRLRIFGRCPAGVEPDIAGLHPPELLKSLPECGEERRSFQVVLGIAHQHADPPHALGLLRACGRPADCSAAENRSDLPPLHSTPRWSREVLIDYQLHRVACFADSRRTLRWRRRWQ